MVLRVSEGPLDRVAARHAVVDVVHVRGELIHRAAVLLSHLGVQALEVGHSCHLLIKLEHWGGNLSSRQRGVLHGVRRVFVFLCRDGR